MKIVINILLVTFCILSFASCGETVNNDDVRARKAIKAAQFKSRKIIEYSYKFGQPDPATAKTLLTTEFDKDGNAVKEVWPNKILTFGYKDIDKKKKLSDIQELNSEHLLQYQTNMEYSEGGTLTTTRFTVDGDMVSKKVAQQDNSQRDTSFVVYDKKGAVQSKVRIRYDDLGLLESVTYGDKDNVVSKISRLHADKEKRQYINYDDKGFAIEVYTEFYNSDNQLVELINNADDSALYRHIKRIYKDNLLYQEIEYFKNGEPKLLIEYTYEK